MGLTRRSVAVAGTGTGSSALEGDLLLALHRELAEVSQVVASPGNDQNVAGRVDRCAEAVRAVADRNDPSPARRLLALAVVGAAGLDLAGVRVDRNVGPVPSGLAADVADVLEQALVCTIGNVHDHARARHAVVTLTTGTDTVDVAVTDDGCGFDLDDVEHPDGGPATALQRLRRAVTEAGGSCSVVTAPGRGTQVTVRMPRPSAERDLPCAW